MMFQGFSLQLFVLVVLLSGTSSLPTRSEKPSLAGKLHSWIKKHVITRQVDQADSSPHSSESPVTVDQADGSPHSSESPVTVEPDSTSTVSGAGQGPSTCSRKSYIHLDTESGVYNISSPNYPGQYPILQHCSSIITVATGKYVSVVFSSTFDIEENTGCGYDYVEVGGFRYCNAQPPPTTPQLYASPLTITFHSDISYAGTGYSITLTQVDQAGHSPVSTVSPMTGQDQPTCSMIPYIDLVAEGGSYNISSSNYPGQYPDNQLCSSIITVATGKYVSVVFSSSFDIEEAAGCIYDYVEVGGFRYCNAQPPLTTPQLYASPLNITFLSDISNTGTGYSITLTQVDQADGSPHTSESPVNVDQADGSPHTSESPVNVDQADGSPHTSESPVNGVPLVSTATPE